MPEVTSADVVRLVITRSAGELEAELRSLPVESRAGIVRDLDDYGEAHCFERLRGCAYYLVRDRRAVRVWRWSSVATPSEAARVRALVSLLDEPLDGRVAERIFERATRRRLAKPRRDERGERTRDSTGPVNCPAPCAASSGSPVPAQGQTA